MDTNRYKKVATLLWAINNSSDCFPSFKAFSWELWGYGFDGQQYIVDKAELEEQLRLVDLLLSTQYWY